MGKDVFELGPWSRCLTSLQVFSLLVLSLQSLSLLLSVQIPGKRGQVWEREKNLFGSQNPAVRGGQGERIRYSDSHGEERVTWQM
jgi:hypothetical protein